ncbi:response regulator [Deltaproteobacteria bacterium]|nr:response regulator [Deltaproteobacteria bacterium]
MAKSKILIVEDDEKIAELLKDYLEEANFNVLTLNRGNNVVNTVRISPPDLILLDVMLPDKDGMTICREIRSFSSVPIVMLTAKVEEIDRLLGLELGADDYICKPFSPREVVARIKAVIRRIRPELTEKKLIMGSLTIDEENYKVTIGESDVNLTPNEYELLRVMMSRPGRVFTRADLVSKTQGYSFNGYDRTIDSHIKNLRKKINEHLPDQKIIHTVYGIGYKIGFQKID